jgi:hypothetical protein
MAENQKMYVKDKGFDPLLNDICVLINEWAVSNQHYNAELKFFVNGFKVRDTKIERGFKHFYAESMSAKTPQDVIEKSVKDLAEVKNK